jgi:GT2 family glycosyltransferase
MILDSAMIFSLVSFIEGSPSTGAVMPKILKWNFNDEEKTNIIDSLGVTTDKYLRFFDHFQGQVDDKQIVIPTDIFGFTGAAALLRLSSLEKIKYGDEYFDESMFMYKEDCDLSLRIRLAGFRIMVEPAALAYHDRTAAAPGNRLALIAANRKNKSRQVKKWSFLNQLIIVYKFSHLLPVGIKLGAWTYQFLSTIYAIFFETYLVKELGAFIRLRHQIKLRSTAMPIAISKEQIGNIFK